MSWRNITPRIIFYKHNWSMAVSLTTQYVYVACTLELPFHNKCFQNALLKIKKLLIVPERNTKASGNVKNNLNTCRRKIWKLIINGTNKKKILANFRYESLYKLKRQSYVQKNLTVTA